MFNACKKEVKIVCDEKFFSPADQQVFQSGDTIKVELGYDVWNLKKGNSVFLRTNDTYRYIYVKEDNGNYEYGFVHTVIDSTIDTVRLYARMGPPNGSVCNEEITVYIEP